MLFSSLALCCFLQSTYHNFFRKVLVILFFHWFIRLWHASPISLGAPQSYYPHYSCDQHIVNIHWVFADWMKRRKSLNVLSLCSQSTPRCIHPLLFSSTALGIQRKRSSSQGHSLPPPQETPCILDSFFCIFTFTIISYQYSKMFPWNNQHTRNFKSSLPASGQPVMALFP